MEVNKDSDLYRKYENGWAAYCAFFRDGSSLRPRDSFCRVMRMAYVWRPLVPVMRVVLMTLVVALPLAALIDSTESFLAGAGTLLALIGVLSCTVVITRRRLKARDAHTRNMTTEELEAHYQPSLFTLWAKALYHRVCPIVEFTEDSDVQDN